MSSTATAPAETPLMKQYMRIKGQYPDALLLFRVGDFYETFMQDAVTAAAVLGITLTKRNNGSSDIELAGFPHHALDNYLPKLVRAGHRVAVCDQLEDPKLAKGVVKRGVTEVATPGVTFAEGVVDGRRNNWLAALCGEGERFGAAFLDITTGEFLAGEGDRATMAKAWTATAPASCSFPRGPSRILSLKKPPRTMASDWNPGPSPMILRRSASSGSSARPASRASASRSLPWPAAPPVPCCTTSAKPAMSG